MLDGNTFGRHLRVTTFGESHGPAMGCVLDGCPAGLALDPAQIQVDLDRRRPGSNKLGTTRNEGDAVELLSGVHEGRTLGTPIGMLVRNTNARSKDYREIAGLYRPSHGDYTYDARYGRRDPRGGGRASARETVGRVAAGAVARALCAELAGIEIVAWVQSVADVAASVDVATIVRALVDAHEVRCGDPAAAPAMEAVIRDARADRDTVGGVVAVVARGVPAGLGAPVFSRLDAALAAALLSIPAAKGVAIGSGFDGTLQRGSEHNDPFVVGDDGAIRTDGNRSGGVQAGISNGMPLVAQVAFKPVATHFLPQQTVTTDGRPTTFQAKGRHDPCVLPRAVPIVEAMVALVVADALLGRRLARA